MQFPIEFLDGDACIKFACKQAHEIVEACKACGQTCYGQFEYWVRMHCMNYGWAYITNGCVHVSSVQRDGVELLWDDVKEGYQEPVIQADDFDALL